MKGERENSEKGLFKVVLSQVEGQKAVFKQIY